MLMQNNFFFILDFYVKTSIFSECSNTKIFLVFFLLFLYSFFKTNALEGKTFFSRRWNMQKIDFVFERHGREFFF